MPQVKQKTKKALVKRLKVTGRGKIMRHRPGAGHLKSRKSPKRLRRMRTEAVIPEMFAKALRTLMNV